MRASKLAVFTLIAGLSLPAFASVSSSASLSGFSYQLIDLNPSDAISPSISWLGVFDPMSGATGIVNASQTSGPLTSFNSVNGGMPWSSISASAKVPLAEARASLSGGSGASPVGASLLASGSALGAQLPGNSSSFSAGVQAPSAYWGSNFVLGAYSAVLFSVTAQVSANTTVGNRPSDIGFGPEYASATARISVSGFGISQPSSDNLSVSASATGFYHWDPVLQQGTTIWGPETVTKTSVLTASYQNSSSLESSALLKLEVGTNGNSAVLAVPEPETYAMLLAGLAIIGGVARKKGSNT